MLFELHESTRIDWPGQERGRDANEGAMTIEIHALLAMIPM